MDKWPNTLLDRAGQGPGKSSEVLACHGLALPDTSLSQDVLGTSFGGPELTAPNVSLGGSPALLKRNELLGGATFDKHTRV